MFYSVPVGRKTGVFFTWGLARSAVLKYPGAIFRKWKTLREAVQHLNEHGIDNDNTDVHTPKGIMSLAAYCEQPPSSGDAFYSVVIGERTGVFTSWSLCRPSIFEFPGALFHKWETLTEATQYLNKYGIGNHEIEIHTTDGKKILHEYCEQKDICLPEEASYEHLTVFNMSNGLFVEIKTFSDGIGVDIHQRDWETGARKDKGIVLNLGQWHMLLTLVPRLNELFHKVKMGESLSVSHCLGESVFVSIHSPYHVFNIRHWLRHEDGHLSPNRLEGITLREREWEHLMNIRPLIANAIAVERDSTCM